MGVGLPWCTGAGSGGTGCGQARACRGTEDGIRSGAAFGLRFRLRFRLGLSELDAHGRVVLHGRALVLSAQVDLV